MRRFAVTLLIAALAASAALPAAAQMGGRRDRGGDTASKDEQEAAKKRQRDKEWNQPQAALPALRNAGPCPYVKVLYDAARYVEMSGESASAVGYTGEIQNISATCRYKDAEPIQVAMQILFAFGKGPQAQGDGKTFRYWVAVTERNKQVIAKEYFDLPVSFDPGRDRVMMTDTISDLVIPRAKMETSGSNFEVLVGFDVTPEMAAFNRDGKRFRLNAGQAQAASAATAPAQ